MTSDKKNKKSKFEPITTADEFIEKWHVWYKGHIEDMRGDLINIVQHNKVGVRFNKTDLIGL